MVSDKFQKLNLHFFWLLAAGVLAFAFMLCWWSGGRGFYPSDSSIVFDGGWRILSGQVPYRDFISPVIVPLYLQALFFKMFGVYFFVLRFHAAFVNMLAAGLGMLLLRFILPAEPLLILAGGALTGIWFYSFWGLPWYLQTSVFFGLAGAVLALAARIEDKTDRQMMLAVWVAPLMLLSFFSKQTSGGLFLALPFFLWLIPPRGRGFWKLFLGYGGGLLVCAGALYGLVTHYADWDLFKYHVFDLPPGNQAQLIAGRYYLSKMMGLLMILTGATLGPVLWRFRRFPQDGQDMYLPLGVFMATVVFHAVCISLSTAPAFNNMPLMGVMLVLAFFLVLSACERMLPRTYGSPAFWLPWILAGVMVLTGTAGIYLVASAQAKGHDATMVLMPPIKSGPLKGLRWSEPINHITRQNVIDVVDFVQRVREPIYVWGGFSILYGISGHPSVGPVLWHHEGVCFPGTYNAKMRAIDLWTRESIQTANPLYVIGAEALLSYKEHPYFKETVRYLQTHYAFEHDRFGRWLLVLKRKDTPS